MYLKLLTKCVYCIAEKNNDVIRLYDLTALSSESVECKNPFTVPVSMLLYRVVRNSKHYLKDGKALNPDRIKILLDICLKNLDKTKYPQVINKLLVFVTILIVYVIKITDCYIHYLHVI